MQHITLAAGPKNPVRGVQRLVERAVVLGLGARQAQAAPALADLVAQYAGLLASQARAHMLHNGPLPECAEFISSTVYASKVQKLDVGVAPGCSLSL